MTPKNKIRKPLFKRIWILSLVVFFAIGASGCASNVEEKSTERLGIVAETPAIEDEV